MSERPRFHLAFPVRDLSEARAFYGDLLGCPEGRSSDEWVDFDFYGHQIVAHLSPNEVGHKEHNQVDGDAVPVRHFGAILSMEEWKTLAATGGGGVASAWFGDRLRRGFRTGHNPDDRGGRRRLGAPGGGLAFAVA